MYVNQMTLDMGDVGKRAVDEFAKRIGAKARIEFAPED
jgi:predicted solute-binding protein